MSRDARLSRGVQQMKPWASVRRGIATNQCCWTSRPCWVNQSAATQWRPVPCRGKPKPSAGAEATRASHDASLQKCLVHGSIRYELMKRMPHPLSTGPTILRPPFRNPCLSRPHQSMQRLRAFICVTARHCHSAFSTLLASAATLRRGRLT